MAGYPMNPMMAGAYMGGGQGGAMNPMAMMGYMDPNLMGAQREIDFGQGLMGEGTSTAPAYPMQALARALQGAVGGYMTHRGMAKFGDAFSQQGGDPGEDPTGAMLSHAYGPHAAITQAWVDSARAPMMRFKLMTEVIPKIMEGLGQQKAGAGENFATPQAGGGVTPVSTMPVADVAKLNQVYAMPPGPARDAAISEVFKGLMVGTGHVTPEGTVEAVPGASETAAGAAGAEAGAKAAATLPTDITKINAGETAKTIVLPPSSVMVKGPGGAAGSAPYVPPYSPTGTAPPPAAPPSGRITGTPAPTAAGQPAMPAPDERPTGAPTAAADPNSVITGPIVDQSSLGPNSAPPPAGGLVHLPGGGMANTMTPQQINLGSDRPKAYREAQGKALSDTMDKVQAGGAAAADSARQLGELSVQLQKSGSGFGIEELAQGAKIAATFGWDVNQLLPENLRSDPVAVDAANKNISELAMVIARANFPGGRITNADLLTAIRATPNLLNQPGANQILINNLQAEMAMKREQAKFFRMYENAPAGSFGGAKFADKGDLDNGVWDAWQGYAEQLPGVPANIKNSFLSYSDYAAKGQAPPFTSMVPQSAKDYLKANPATRALFDQKYGSGEADKVLGGGQ